MTFENPNSIWMMILTFILASCGLMNVLPSEMDIQPDIEGAPRIEPTATAIPFTATPLPTTTPTLAPTLTATVEPTALPPTVTVTPTATEEPEVNAGYPLAIWLRVPTAIDEADLLFTRDVLAARLDAAEIPSEVVLVAAEDAENEEQIKVSTDGESDVVVPLLLEIGLLEFVDVPLDEMPEAGACILTAVQLELYPGVVFCEGATDTVYETAFTSEWVDAAALYQDEITGGAGVSVEFDPQRETDIFQLTLQRIGDPLAIVFDGVVISTPIIQSGFSTSALIVGIDNVLDASVMVQMLNSGQLPNPVELVGIKSYEVGSE